VAAGKHAQSVAQPVKDVLRELGWASAVQIHAAGSSNMMNMEKVRFQGMGTHVSTSQTRFLCLDDDAIDRMNQQAWRAPFFLCRAAIRRHALERAMIP
jgi:hypothetical protein